MLIFVPASCKLLSSLAVHHAHLIPDRPCPNVSSLLSVALGYVKVGSRSGQLRTRACKQRRDWQSSEPSLRSGPVLCPQHVHRRDTLLRQGCLLHAPYNLYNTRSSDVLLRVRTHWLCSYWRTSADSSEARRIRAGASSYLSVGRRVGDGVNTQARVLARKVQY